ncbi:MAG TPA: hypothetical protein VK968_11060 [Roseimicrobium sp.]|nr:hypothetical protein [Roseimicrobium sp.]
MAEISVALHGEDPFLRSLAVTALARPANRPQWTALWQSKDAAIRLGVLLAWRQSGNAPSPTLLQQAVSDPSEPVRKIAMMWTGETMQQGVAFDRAVTSGSASSDLLDLYIATLQVVQSDDATWMKSGRAWFQHNRAMDLALARRMVTDESKPVALRAVILRTLGQETLQGLSGSLFNWAIRAAEPLRTETVRSLGGIISTDSAAVLRRVALNAGEDPSLRADAILALTGQPAIELVPLASLLYEKEVAVAVETARVFSNSRDPSLRLQMIDRLNDSAAPMNPLVREQFEFALYDISRLAAARPSNDIAWSKAVRVAGDAVAGRRVFFLPTVGCAGCHRVHGRGGLAGPDLSGIGRTSPRERLMRSILHPSEEIAPQYQAQIVELRDGTRVHGTQFHVRSEGTAGVWLQDGTFASIPAANINAHYPSKVSIMPEGLVDRMTVSDMRNLIAFLVSLR